MHHIWKDSFEEKKAPNEKTYLILFIQKLGVGRSHSVNFVVFVFRGGEYG